MYVASLESYEYDSHRFWTHQVPRDSQNSEYPLANGVSHCHSDQACVASEVGRNSETNTGPNSLKIRRIVYDIRKKIEERYREMLLSRCTSHCVATRRDEYNALGIR